MGNDISDFAEVGEFVNTTYRHFSSGMKVRLAFSVVSRLRDPVLLADEVLAVGDKAFRQKGHARIAELLAGRTTLFLFPPSASDLGRFCQRGLDRRSDELRGDGPIEDIIEQYEADISVKAPAYAPAGS